MQYTTIKDIKRNPSNPRIIKDKGFKKLKESLSSARGKEHFEARPCIVSTRTGENIIIAGNTRYQAAIDLKWEEVPCVFFSDLTEEQENEIIIRDNVSNGEWDWDTLMNEWNHNDLVDWGLEIPDTEVLEDGQAEEDDYEVPQEIKTDIVVGDLFTIGEHRLLCGDSTDVLQLETLMNRELADMVFTDPPYNTGMTGKTQGAKTLWRGKGKNPGTTWLSHMFDDAYTDEEWASFLRSFVSNYYIVMKDDSVAYICLDWRRSYELVPVIKEHFHLSNVIVWDKVVHGLGSDYKYTYELIHVCKKGKPEMNTHQGDREYSDVWHIQRKTGRDDEHATKKPIELCERGIRHASKKGEVVLDIFLGSGTTMIAAHQLGRKCYGMELDPKYCQVIIDRMIKLDPELKVTRNGKPY